MKTKNHTASNQSMSTIKKVTFECLKRISAQHDKAQADKAQASQDKHTPKIDWWTEPTTYPDVFNYLGIRKVY